MVADQESEKAKETSLPSTRFKDGSRTSDSPAEKNRGKKVFAAETPSKNHETEGGGGGGP